MTKKIEGKPEESSGPCYQTYDSASKVQASRRMMRDRNETSEAHAGTVETWKQRRSMQITVHAGLASCEEPWAVYTVLSRRR